MLIFHMENNIIIGVNRFLSKLNEKFVVSICLFEKTKQKWRIVGTGGSRILTLNGLSIKIKYLRIL